MQDRIPLYTAIWNDRHSDTTVHSFSDRDAAIKWAKAKVKECIEQWPGREDDLDEELTDSMKAGGWIYYGCYSCEGDSIRVVRHELDGEL